MKAEDLPLKCRSLTDETKETLAKEINNLLDSGIMLNTETLILTTLAAILEEQWRQSRYTQGSTSVKHKALDFLLSTKYGG